MQAPNLLHPILPPYFMVLAGDDELQSQATNTSARGAWPAANRGIYLPLRLPVTEIVTAVTYDCNSTTGASDLAIYDGITLARLQSRGATTNAVGTNTWTLTTPEVIRAGWLYYLGMSCSSATPTILRFGTAVIALRVVGAAQQASVGTLPDPMVPAQVASAYMPVIVLRFAQPTA